MKCFEVRRCLVVVALCSYAGADAFAQARPLTSADFVVAGIPDDYPYLDIAVDTACIRKILGAPRAVGYHEMQPGDTLTTWQYQDLTVTFGSISRLGITLTSPRIATHRGLRVGDPERRLRSLYGPPAWQQDSEWIYEDPRERLHVIQVTVEDGVVREIFVGSLWD